MEVAEEIVSQGGHNLTGYQTVYAQCEISPSCLECPLPECRYDLSLMQQRTYMRLAYAQKLRKERRLTWQQVGLFFDVSWITLRNQFERLSEQQGMNVLKEYVGLERFIPIIDRILKAQKRGI